MAMLDLKPHGLELKGHVTIHGGLHFERPVLLWSGVTVHHCRIGAYSYISPNTYGHLATIGRYCSIGENVKLGLTQHPVDHLLTSPISYKPVFGWHQTYMPPGQWNELVPLEIGHDVWIGTDATVLSGVRVGTGCIIATKAVVTKDVPPYAVVAGIPAKIVKMRFSDTMVERLLALELWRYDLPKWWAQSEAGPQGSLTEDALAMLEDAASANRLPLLEDKVYLLQRGAAGWSVS